MSCYGGLASDQKAVDGAGCYHIPVYGQGLETIAARSSSSSPQLPEFIAVASSYPHIQFILPLMGWPIDLSEAGHRDRKRDLKTLSGCENVKMSRSRSLGWNASLALIGRSTGSIHVSSTPLS